MESIRVAKNVFALFVAKSFESYLDLSARNMKASSEMRHSGVRIRVWQRRAKSWRAMSYGVPLLSQKFRGVCVSRGVGIEIGVRANGSVEIVTHNSDDWKEWQFRFGLVTFAAGGDRDMTISIANSEYTRFLKRVRASFAGGVQARLCRWSQVWKSRCGLFDSKGGRLTVSEGREATQRKDKRCKVETMHFDLFLTFFEFTSPLFFFSITLSSVIVSREVFTFSHLFLLWIWTFEFF